MENPELGNELIRMSLSEIQSGQIFEWAKQKYLFERDNGSDHRRRSNVEELANTLNKHLKDNFALQHDIDSHSLEMHFPDVVVTTKDAYYTSFIERHGPLSYIVHIEPMPLGSVEEIVGEHTIAGPLTRFHVGEVKDDLRMYIQAGATINPQGESIYAGHTLDTMGGILRPMVSVSVAQSEIRFAEQTSAERLEELGETMRRKLTEIGDDKLNGYFLSFIQTVNEKGVTQTQRLQESTKTILMITSLVDLKVYQHLIDDLCEYLSIKLNFQMPHEIESNSHRVVIPQTNPREKGRQEPYTSIHRYHDFVGIQPKIELIGVANQKTLALSFSDEGKSVQVPVFSIHRIHRMNP